MLDGSKKPSKIWVDKGSKFYSSSFKKWLKDIDIEMYSIHSEGKKKLMIKILNSKSVIM